MNCNPTITAESFKTIHNALCSLDSIENEKVAQLVEEMRSALAGAYEQENTSFEIKMDYKGVLYDMSDEATISK